VKFERAGEYGMKKLVIAGVLAVSTVVLAAVPAGWKVVTDKKRTCQYAVPPDWTQDKLITNSATSPDGKSNVLIHGNEQSLAEIKPMIQQMIPSDKTIEDSGKRYWYSYKHLANGSDLAGTNWYVGVAVPGGICAAQLSFKNPAAESVMKQIVDTIAPAQ
jgi:hypothetical protein